MVMACNQLTAYAWHVLLVQVNIKVPAGVGQDPVMQKLAHFNISKDDVYSGVKRGQGDKSSQFATGKHSQPANELLTIPVFPDDAIRLDWHRPRGIWWPYAVIDRCMYANEAKYAAHASIRVWFRNLVGREFSVTPDHLDHFLAGVWTAVKPKYDCDMEEPLLVGGEPLQFLDPTRWGHKCWSCCGLVGTCATCFVMLVCYNAHSVYA